MNRRFGAVAVLAGAIVASTVALVVVATRHGPGPRTLQQRVRAVASTLRCPVCQDLSVADSPSGLARQMRGQIASDLRAGQSPAEIRAEFVRAYGEWILLSPPAHGLNLLVWVVPAVVLLVGAGVVMAVVRRWTLGVPTAATDAGVVAISGSDRALLDRALAEELDEDGAE
jgi:cytochrome c-type biogenesis protein CcmH